MEPSNDSSEDGFSNPNPNPNPTAAFTFTTQSASAPRFLKLRKHNNAPSFNPFRDAPKGDGDSAGLSDQMRSLKIGNVNDAFSPKGEFAFPSPSETQNLVSKLPDDLSNLRIVTEGVDITNEIESQLQNDLRNKLNLQQTQQVGIGGNNGGGAVADNPANAVISQLKNLHVNDSLGNTNTATTHDVRKSEVDAFNFAKPETGIEPILLRKMDKLNLVNQMQDSFQSNLSNSASGGQFASAKLKEDIGMSQTATSSSMFLSSGGINFQPFGTASGVTKRDEFVFTGKQDSSGSSFVEFKTPAPKTNLFGGVDEKLKSTARKEKSSNTRMNKSRTKLKHCTLAQPWHGQGFVFKETISQEDPQGSLEAYSPMDVSPYQEKLAENQISRENSVTSNESFSVDSNSIANDSAQTTSADPIDEDIIAATERLKINGGDLAFGETTSCENVYVVDPKDESVSGVETESFKSACDEVDITSDVAGTSAETEAHNTMLHLGSALCSNNVSGSAFTFAASSSPEAQLPSPKRHYKKKNWVNIGHDTYNYTPNIKVPYSSSSMGFSPFSGTSSLYTLGQGLKTKVSSPQPKTRDSEENKEEGLKKASASISAAIDAAQEACEKWRLRCVSSFVTLDYNSLQLL